METPAVFRLLPALVSREKSLDSTPWEKFLENLSSHLPSDVLILSKVTICRVEDVEEFEKLAGEADAVLIYKVGLGLGDALRKIAEAGKPLLLFAGTKDVRYALDALEYVYPRKETWVATDFEDLVVRLRALLARKRLAHTRVLVLNADYLHWQRWLCRVQGGLAAIKARFGVEVQGIRNSEFIQRWQNVDPERVTETVRLWREEAKEVVEPGEEDLEVVAKLYLAMEDLLTEHSAHGLTMAYGEDPLPVPCVPYMWLRDRGFPAACEADILSLLTMVMVHHLLDKPSFMGNTFIDLENNVILLSHCVAPRKMAGYKGIPLPYVLRSQHWGKQPGSLSAFVELTPGQEVTVCRLAGDLRSMLLANGEIQACEDLAGFCRITARVKLNGSAREFIRRTSGNHHVLVYGDHRDELQALNELLGIETIKI